MSSQRNGKLPAGSDRGLISFIFGRHFWLLDGQGTVLERDLQQPQPEQLPRLSANHTNMKRGMRHLLGFHAEAQFAAPAPTPRPSVNRPRGEWHLQLWGSHLTRGGICDVLADLSSSEYHMLEEKRKMCLQAGGEISCVWEREAASQDCPRCLPALVGSTEILQTPTPPGNPPLQQRSS